LSIYYNPNVVKRCLRDVLNAIDTIYDNVKKLLGCYD